MQLLLLTPQLPYPPQQGTSLRNYHIIRGLAAHHEITLLSFLESNQKDDVQAIGPLLDLCTAVYTTPVPVRSTNKRIKQLITTRRPDMEHRLHSTHFDIKLKQLLSGTQFDIVQIEGIELARTIDIIRVVSPSSRIVFDDHNAETELQRRALQADRGNPRRWAAAGYSQVQVGRLGRFEAWACQAADWVTAVSEQDKTNLTTLIPDLKTPISVIPNCIDVLQFKAVQDKVAFDFDLVFSGKMDYRPNVDAVLWFADHVWPLIMQERPSTTWAIVGQKPHARLQRLESLPGVTVTGWVDSVQPFLVGAQVYIMPFRVGSGTRLKLIEAMAAGKAIVSTPMGAEGFPVRDQQELLLAETPDEMATAVNRLLSNPAERKRLGKNAQALADHYDWRRVIPQFETIYHQLVE